jgi:hypothetical protein
MIGAVVTFHFGDNFDERAVRKIAETARTKFGSPLLDEIVQSVQHADPQWHFVPGVC